jgi:autotransporter-associated beta strand protein
VGQFGGAAYGGTVTYNLSGANGYTMQLGSGASGTGMLNFYNNTVLNSNTPGVTLSIPGGLDIDYPLSYNLTFTGPGNISMGSIVPYNAAGTEIPTFAGTGIVTLTGSNTYTANTTVNSGIVILAAGAAIADTSQILIANVSGTGAAFYQSGAGSLVSNTTTSLGDFQVGAAVGAAGYYNLSAGAIDVSSLNTTSGGEIDIGGASGGAATFAQFDMTGGSVVLPNQTQTYFLANRGAAGEASIVNFLGGTVTIAGGATPADNGIDGIAANWTTNQTATITIGGTAQVLTPSLWVKLNVGTGYDGAGTVGDTATLNLDGGILQAFGIEYTGTNSTLNFNGGTLMAGNGTNSSFVTGLAGSYVYAGGGTINNNGQAITIAQALLAVSGSGVGSVAVGNGGTGYSVPPEVTISGGGGKGASAYATISATSGAVTGIIITCPGTGYNSVPSVSLSGITMGTAATPGAVTMVANSGTGAMTFSGAGTTTLTAVETYTAPTIVNSGTLAIANTTNAGVSGLNSSSAITINNGATINISTTTDNALLGSVPSSIAPLTINAGGTLTTSDSGHLGPLVLAGGALAENASPTTDQASWGVYDLDHGVTAGGTTTTSLISAQDIGLTQNGGTVFNVSPGASNGIDLLVTGGFADLSMEGNDNGLIKTGNGVMLLAGTSNYLSATAVNGGTFEVSGSLGTTNVNVTGSATLSMSGGVITTGTVQIGASASLAGYGTINGLLVNQGTVVVSGSLTLTKGVQNNGIILVTGSGTLAVGGTFINNGTLDVMDSPRTTLPAGLVNNGIILTSANVAVLQSSRSGNSFAVTMQSYVDHTYQLYSSPDLHTWSAAGNAQQGTGGTIVLTDSNATASGEFYKVGVGP